MSYQVIIHNRDLLIVKNGVVKARVEPEDHTMTMGDMSEIHQGIKQGLESLPEEKHE